MFETTSGLGHMRRSAGIANALALAGANVRVASGTFVDRENFFRSNIRFIDLPEHRVYNKKLNIWYHYDNKGRKVQDHDFDEKAWRTNRDDVIIKALEEEPVHAVLVEFWPFSRRREFSSTIDRISKINIGKLGKPLIFSSSRDILETANSMKKKCRTDRQGTTKDGGIDPKIRGSSLHSWRQQARTLGAGVQVLEADRE